MTILPQGYREMDTWLAALINEQVGMEPRNVSH